MNSYSLFHTTLDVGVEHKHGEIDEVTHNEDDRFVPETSKTPDVQWKPVCNDHPYNKIYYLRFIQ